MQTSGVTSWFERRRFGAPGRLSALSGLRFLEEINTDVLESHIGQLVNRTVGPCLDAAQLMSRPGLFGVGRKGLTRNLTKLTTITADKSYDWDALRHELRGAGIRPVTKHREFYTLDKARNARHDENVCHRQSIVEAVFFALKHRLDETLRARTWFGQFREIILKAAVRNIEQTVSF